MSEPLLDVRELAVSYPGRWRAPATRAVDDIDLSIMPGETVGLVGESGSGKTSVGAAVLGLAPVSRGAVRFDGEDITHANAARRRALSAKLQVVFQSPYHSLNPARTVAQTLVEPLLVHGRPSRQEQRDRIAEMLETVGLDTSAATRYPRQFSGGQRQRIAIARALIVRPRLVICDEAVSALDLSVQAQVLNLLLTLQGQLSLSYLFISHDLAVVRHMAQRIVVLYRGQVMESGPAETLWTRSGHPYTQALLAAAPTPDPAKQRRSREARAAQPNRTAREVTDSSGCPFFARCPLATSLCEATRPALEPGPTGALVACHHRGAPEILSNSAAGAAMARAPDHAVLGADTPTNGRAR